MRIRNVSRFGDLEIPSLGVTVAAGEVIDLPKEQAEALLAQPDNFQPVTTKAAPAKEDES